jgi:hypothetical protein
MFYSMIGGGLQVHPIISSMFNGFLRDNGFCSRGDDSLKKQFSTCQTGAQLHAQYPAGDQMD